MKTLSLFLVLAFAKVITLAGREIPLAWGAVPAFLWQDALVTVLFGGFELATRRKPWVSWAVYAAIVVYSALNVPLVRILSSPLTWQMSRAAGGALTDSIGYYCSWETFGCFGLVIGSAAALPFLLKRLSQWTRVVFVVALLALVVVGPMMARRVETRGLDRNALAAFVRSLWPRVTARIDQRDWRRSPWALPVGEDLSRFRGAAAGRNVALILLESTGAQYLRPYGANQDPTPHLSRLTEQSILFENAYAVYPESIKGLFSVLCSRYPAFDTAAEDYERLTTTSLAQVLTEAGYRTGLFHSGRFGYLGMESVIRHRGFELLEDAGAIGGNVQSSFGVDEPATVGRMLSWIDGLPPAGNFFITYLPIAGHHPYDSPEPRPFGGSDERTHYLNALHYGDRALGQFLDGLKERGLDTNTLFVILGDHGEAFGQHEGNHGHTLFVYEENVRVPCLIAAPGLWQQQWRVTNVASLIDIGPTMLELLGLSKSMEWQGTSLLMGPGRMALFYTDYSLGWVGLRDGPWKFIHEVDSARSRLFQLATDPAETQDMSAHQPERVAFYRDHLEAWSAAQKGHFVLTHGAHAAAP